MSDGDTNTRKEDTNMAKLSQIVKKLQSYLELHGDKDVTSIGTVCGSDVEYKFNLHDVYYGFAGSNPYTGEDTIEILRDCSHLPDKPESYEQAKEEVSPDDPNEKALYALRQFEHDLEKQQETPYSNKVLALWGATELLKYMKVADENDMNKLWNEFALKQLSVK